MFKGQDITSEKWEQQKELFEFIVSENMKRKHPKIREVKVTDKPFQLPVENKEGIRAIVETRIPVFVKVDGSHIGDDWSNYTFIDLCTHIMSHAAWENHCGVWFEHIVDEKKNMQKNESKLYYREGNYCCAYFYITFREYAE